MCKSPRVAFSEDLALNLTPGAQAVGSSSVWLPRDSPAGNADREDAFSADMIRHPLLFRVWTARSHDRAKTHVFQKIKEELQELQVRKKLS